MIKDKILEKINESIEEKSSSRFPNGVSVSLLSTDCDRRAFNNLRWAVQEKHEARQLRLFETGHCEELRLINWLRDAGYTVTDEQKQITDKDILLNGYIDGIVYGVTDAPCLLECKTHNDKSFKQLVKKGVAGCKPEHIDQVNVYMHYTELKRCVYIAKNKNDDDIYIELIDYNPTVYESFYSRARYLLNTDTLPYQISTEPDYFLCKSFKCPSYGLCHGEDVPLKNCRTCAYVGFNPVDKGWHCNRSSSYPNLDLQKQVVGCEKYASLYAESKKQY